MGCRVGFRGRRHVKKYPKRKNKRVFRFGVCIKVRFYKAVDWFFGGCVVDNVKAQFDKPATCSNNGTLVTKAFN